MEREPVKYRENRYAFSLSVALFNYRFLFSFFLSGGLWNVGNISLCLRVSASVSALLGIPRSPVQTLRCNPSFIAPNNETTRIQVDDEMRWAGLFIRYVTIYIYMWWWWVLSSHMSRLQYILICILRWDAVFLHHWLRWLLSLRNVYPCEK